MIYAYIDEQRVHGPVVRLCHALGVSTSGYYAGRQRGPSQRERAHEALLVHLRAIRVETHETYGSPRMQAELVARDNGVDSMPLDRLGPGQVSRFPE